MRLFVGRVSRSSRRAMRVGILERVEHDIAPGHSGIDGQLGMPRSKADSLALRAVAGTVASVPKLAEAHHDARETAKDSLDRSSGVRARVSRPGVQTDGLLGTFDQRRQIVLVVDLLATFLQDRLGSALDQFLGRADGKGRVRLSGSLEPCEELSDRSRITEIGILPLLDLKIAAPPISAS